MKGLKRAIAWMAAVVTVMSLGLMTACGNTPPEPPPSGEVTVTRIALNTDDVKKTYEIGETFTTEGIKVTAYMSDDTDKAVEISECTVTKPDMTTAGNKPVTVSYGGKSANYIIVVNAPKAHECGMVCVVCGGCLDPDCAEDACIVKCGDKDGLTEYKLEAEDPHVRLVGGERGALNIVAVIDDAGVPPEIKDRNKDIKYIGNYNANPGASINYTIYAEAEGVATLYVSVCKRLNRAIFTQGCGLIVNEELIELPVTVPETGTGADTWADFVTVNLGCIRLNKGLNRIKFTNLSPDFGYNFDKILIKSPIAIGWWEDMSDYSAVFDRVEKIEKAVTEITADTQIKFHTFDTCTARISAMLAADVNYSTTDLASNVEIKLDGKDVTLKLAEPFKGKEPLGTDEAPQSQFVKVEIGDANGYADFEAGDHVLTLSAKGDNIPLIEKVTLDMQTYGELCRYIGIVLNTENVKVDYVLGEELDVTGLTATVTKRDGTTEKLGVDDLDIASVKLSGFGTYSITVKAGNVSAAYSVVVKPEGNLVEFKGINAKLNGCHANGDKVGGFADEAGRSITFEIDASAECDVALYVTVSTNAMGRFAQNTMTTINGVDITEIETAEDGIIKGNGGPTGWDHYVSVYMGVIHLQKGKNVIVFTHISSPGNNNNFDKIELIVPDEVTLDWYADEQA